VVNPRLKNPMLSSVRMSSRVTVRACELHSRSLPKKIRIKNVLWLQTAAQVSVVSREKRNAKPEKKTSLAANWLGWLALALNGYEVKAADEQQLSKIPALDLGRDAEAVITISVARE